MLEKNEIDIRKIISILVSNLWLIIFITLAFTVAGAIITRFFVAPVYQSSAILIVNSKNQSGQQQQDSITTDQIKTATELVSTYAIIIKSDTVLDKVIENLDLASVPGMSDIDAKKLSKNISVTSLDNTQIMEIAVRNTNSDLAQDIASEIVKIAPDIIIKTVKAGSVEIISPAKSNGKVSPNLFVNTFIAFIVGFFVSLLIAFLRTIFDNTIRSDEDIINYLDMPVLGIIPKVEGRKD